MDNNNILTDSVKNKRGDEVKISTEIFDNRLTPERTVVRLRRTHNGFWVTLLIVNSFGIHEELIWKNDNDLDVNLDFGCIVQIKNLKNKIGPIKIFYHFTENNRNSVAKTPRGDNSLTPDPDQPCPASH